MTLTMLFWLLAAVLTLGALAFLFGPLYRTEVATLPRTQGRRWPLYALLPVLPAMALGMYLHLGAPAIIEAQQLTEAHDRRDVDAMMTALEASLKTNPDDARGWYVLGQAYIALDMPVEAEAALAKALKLKPKEASYLSQYAEALALASGNLEGRPLELINEALELNFEDEKALELAGLAAYQRREWALAGHFWRRLLKLLPTESEFHDSIKAGLADAENKVAEASGLGERAKLQAVPQKKIRTE